MIAANLSPSCNCLFTDWIHPCGSREGRRHHCGDGRVDAESRDKDRRFHPNLGRCSSAPSNPSVVRRNEHNSPRPIRHFVIADMSKGDSVADKAVGFSLTNANVFTADKDGIAAAGVGPLKGIGGVLAFKTVDADISHGGFRVFDGRKYTPNG